jgi:hypothetical protein
VAFRSEKRAVFYLRLSTIMVHVPYKIQLLKRVKKKEANPIKVSDIGEIVENGDHFLQHINVAHKLIRITNFRNVSSDMTFTACRISICSSSSSARVA